MKKIKAILNFYINSSIHVALAVVCLSLVTSLNHQIVFNRPLSFFIFFGTITAYNFVKYAGIAKLHHRKLTRKLKTIQIFSIFSLLAFLLSALYVHELVLIWSAFFGLLTLLYALPVFGAGRNLRSIAGLKIFIIAFVWAGVSVVLPVVQQEMIISPDIIISFIQRFLLMIILILPFDIRDLKFDLLQLRTLPQRMGVTRTKLFGFFLLGLILILEFFKKEVQNASIAALLLIVLVSALLVWGARERQSFYYSAFWVEAVPILWLVVLVFFTAI